MKSLWPDGFVEEVNLSQNIFRLRKVLGETPGQQYIATIAGQGYRFIADVREIHDDTLVIESHTRERVVFEEEGEDDHETGKLVVVPALQAGRNLWQAYWLIPLAVAIATLVWFALPPKPPRLLASTQITNDGRLKWQKYQGWEGPLLLTDGSRIFMVEDGQKGQMLVQVPVSGGETVPVSVPVPFPRPGDRFASGIAGAIESDLVAGREEAGICPDPRWPGAPWYGRHRFAQRYLHSYDCLFFYFRFVQHPRRILGRVFVFTCSENSCGGANRRSASRSGDCQS
jgi:hypothetical protein